MIILYIVLSLQKVVVLDDLGILGGSREISNVPSRYSADGRREMDGSDSTPNTKKYGSDAFSGMSPENERLSPNFDLEGAVREYVKRKHEKPSQNIANKGLGPDKAANRQETNNDSRMSKGAGQDGIRPSKGGEVGGRDEGQIDISVPYTNKAIPDTDPSPQAGAKKGGDDRSNPTSERRAGVDSANSKYLDSLTRTDVSDFEKDAEENIASARTAKSSYLEAKVRESKDRQEKIVQQMERVDEKIERLVHTLGEAQSRAQKAQIDLLNQRNSIKNQASRRENSEKLVRRLGAEIRVLNNEIIKLSKELDEKKMRLESLNDDLGVQSARIKGMADEMASKNNEIEHSTLRKDTLDKEIMRMENAVTKLKDERDSLAKERSKEGAAQARLENEKEKISDGDLFS